MLIRYFWRNRKFQNKNGVLISMDCFWIEATQEEAEREIYPKLALVVVSESRALAERYINIARYVRNPACPFCFLVSRDLNSIEPFSVHYPFNPMWNAYSPFETMPEVAVKTLEQIQNLVLPVIPAN